MHFLDFFIRKDEHPQAERKESLLEHWFTFWSLATILLFVYKQDFVIVVGYDDDDGD